jgi:hypothetical protein
VDKAYSTRSGEEGRGALRKITSKHQHSTSVSLDFHPTPPECEVCYCVLPTNGYTSYPSRHSPPSRFVSALRKHPLHLRSMSGRSLVLPTLTRWQDTLAMNTKCHGAAPNPTRSYPLFFDFSHGANTYFGPRPFASRRPIYLLFLRL